MAQCPTGYTPRLFWPGSHFYGFMGRERNLWRPVYSRATSAGTFTSWVAVASPLVTDPPAFLSLFLSLPYSRRFSPPHDHSSSYFPKFRLGLLRCPRPTAACVSTLSAPAFSTPSAPGTMVTPSFVSRRDRRARYRTSCPSSKLKPSFSSANRRGRTL